MGKLTICIGHAVVCVAVLALAQGKIRYPGITAGLTIFQAYRNTSFTGSSTVVMYIPYDLIDINEGDSYAAATGTFTAPSNGYYHFSWFTRPDDSCGQSSQFRTILYKNNVEQVAKAQSADENSHSASVNVALLTGDVVNVGIGTGSQCFTSYGGGGGKWLGFSGHLAFNMV